MRAAAVAAMLGSLVAGSTIVSIDSAQAAPPSTNVFAGARLYVDPVSEAARAADAVETSDPEAAMQLDKVARGSTADWFTSIPAHSLTSAVADRVATIRGAGAMPVFVAYNIPYRDCGSYSGGGAAGADAYKAWIRAFAAGIGNARAAVILEPDALAQLSCLSPGKQTQRLELLRYAVRTLVARPGTAVYLDAGNAGWVPAAEMGRRLNAAGVGSARGFALNVSNYFSNHSSIVYGRAVSAATRGARFVIDTSRNGRGVAPDKAWCNPPGRGLGALPGGKPASSLVDAYLWIKHPGYSDGTCNGGPIAGQWWPEYARMLAANAAW